MFTNEKADISLNKIMKRLQICFINIKEGSTLNDHSTPKDRFSLFVECMVVLEVGVVL